ncbi:MAG: hypothetical protein Q9216_003397 [Gyalolechia sp. 2 TL-2023]
MKPEDNNRGGYDVNKTLTAQLNLDFSFNISFPYTQVSGFVVEDTIELSDKSINLENFAFGVAHDQSSGVVKEPWDGLLGFAFRDPTTPGTLSGLPTFFESIMPKLENPTFALDFQRNTNRSTGPSITFGAIDPTRFTAELLSTPIDSSGGRWTAKDIKFSVRGRMMEERANLTFGVPLQSIPLASPTLIPYPDTGLGAAIFVPMSIIDEYYSQVQGLQWGNQMSYNCTVTVPCDSKLPNFEMHIGNGVARIGSKNMMGEPLSNSVSPAQSSSFEKRCLPALQPFGNYPGKSCLEMGFIGAPFFLENYVVFNQADPSLSYAPYA